MHIGLGIDRRIGCHAHLTSFGLSNMVRDLPKRPGAACDGVVGGFHAIQVDIPGQKRATGKPLKPQGHQQSVCAKIDCAVLVDEPLNEFVEMRVEQGFPTTDAHDGSPAFPGGLKAFFHIHHAVAERGIFPDPSTTLAPKVAGKKGFQHQHERRPSAGRQSRSQEVPCDAKGKGQ